MLELVQIVLFFIVPLAYSDFVPQAKVFLGNEATPHEFPWVAIISDLEGQFICAASILNENWILTCSHCVMFSNPGLLSVVTGDHDLSLVEGTEYYHRVLRVITHPEYSENPIKNDIALIKVYPPITFDTTIQSITLPPQFPTDPNEAFFAGWGYKERGSSLSSRLTKAVLPIITVAECQSMYSDAGTSNVDEKNICAGKNGLCRGDSGGPLVYLEEGNPIVYGIASFGTFCGDADHPGVFTRVSSHLEFIFKYINADVKEGESRNSSCFPYAHFDILMISICLYSLLGKLI